MVMVSSRELTVAGGRGYEITKRLVDIFGALTGIVFFAPVMLVIAVAVKLGSVGSIFYLGTRSGRNGKEFKIIKFRSMVVGADLGAGTTSREDSRVTNVGKFIRRYKLDELPQFFNVLVGDMSFVGPRPELICYTNQYKGDELLILQVRPGITDYASLAFSQLNEIIADDDPDRSFEERVLPEKNRLRVKYVTERSLLLDLKLIFATVLRVFLGN